jgi:hypothetical protein
MIRDLDDSGHHVLTEDADWDIPTWKTNPAVIPLWPPPSKSCANRYRKGCPASDLYRGPDSRSGDDLMR